MPVKTTTWKGRNLGKMKELRAFIPLGEAAHKDFLIIGPGGMLQGFEGLLPSGDPEEWGSGQKRQYFLFHQLESLFRKSRLFKLKCFELDDLLSVFGSDAPGSISILDIEPLVLDSLKRSYGSRINTIQADLSTEISDVRADVVICYNTVQRVPDPQQALKNITGFLRPNGLLSMALDPRIPFDPQALALRPQSTYIFRKQEMS